MTAPVRSETGLCGIGMGWRPEIAGVFAELPGLGFTEVVAENLQRADGTPAVPATLASIRARGIPVVPHGIGLSLGGAEPVEARRVRYLADCLAALDAPLASEHIAFVRAGGLEAGHLLPVPRTKEALSWIVTNVRRAQAELPVPIALEPIAALFDWPDAELTEGQFLAEILERTGALLLLDVANVYANARNAGLDPHAELAALPTGRIAYCHVAGGAEHGGLYHDTHTDAVPEPVLALVRQLAAERPDLAWLLERDGDYPPVADLRRELDLIAAAAGQESVT
jgi:uncharacterized protein (UPF0276 family)